MRAVSDSTPRWQANRGRLLSRVRGRILGLGITLAFVVGSAGCTLLDPGDGESGTVSEMSTDNVKAEYERGTPWEIDFSTMPDGALDPAVWNFVTGNEVPGYNNEEQTYTDRTKNVRIEGGELIIQAHDEFLNGRNYTSARIDTLGAFDFRYGTIEIVAKLPRGAGTWPAAWLMPSDPQYGPVELGVPPGHRFEFAVNGEIDFMEAIGNVDNEVLHSAHSYNQLNKATIYSPVQIDDAYGQFHTYGLIKKPGSLEFTHNGEVITTFTQQSDDPLWWPFEQDYYLILNLAMGGPWAGSNVADFPPDGIDRSMADHWSYRIKGISYQPLPE